MFSRYALGPGIALTAIIRLGAACGAPEDPFTSGPARATVTGMVTASGGTPIPGATIHVACGGGGPPSSVSTDSTGRYIINLYTGSNPFDGDGGHLPCRFSEPASGKARVQLDTSLGFVRGPVLVALQYVDLREP